MKYANQTEFFLSEDCIPRNLRIRSRLRFDALQKEASSLKGYIESLEEKVEYALRLAESLQNIQKLEIRICELKYFDGDNCTNPHDARKALESITVKGKKARTWIGYAEVLNSGIVDAKARLSKINDELSELCNYIID